MGCGASKIRENRTKRWVDELTAVDGYFLDFEGWQEVIQGHGWWKRETGSEEEIQAEAGTQQKECMFTDSAKKMICGLVSSKVHAKVKRTTPIPLTLPCLIPMRPSRNLRRIEPLDAKGDARNVSRHRSWPVQGRRDARQKGQPPDCRDHEQLGCRLAHIPPRGFGYGQVQAHQGALLGRLGNCPRGTFRRCKEPSSASSPSRKSVVIDLKAPNPHTDTHIP
jgi:hypothetical protein